MTCPDGTQLLGMLEGALTQHEIQRMSSHLDRCTHCRAALADMARARSAGARDGTGEVGSFARTLDTSLDDEAGDPLPLDAGRRYVVLGLLAAGGMGRVHRAIDRLTGRVVALKHVPLHAAGDGPAAPAIHLEALAQEFRTLATLRHPNIISVLDYGIGAGHRPFFTMELLHDAEPLLPFARSAPPAVQIDLLVQLLRALGYLHRRGVLHRDLKPSNILVLRAHDGPDAAGGPLLKVLDFGLSTGSTDVNRFRVAGTLPYMAPELLRREAASEASDIYAVGVLACEMLAGRHPFDGWRTGPELVRKILTAPPDLGALAPPLRAVIGRALARSPASRPASPAALVRDLCEATGLPVPHDPAPARDSYLVAAKLVGRDHELDELRRALEDARRGRGSAWLVGGESGAGKSRLLDELRTWALVDGMIVAQGQAAPSGGSAYGAWRGALPILALNVELSDLEASVLGTIVPGLDALLEREVPPPPELDAQGARYRLLRVLRDVVARSPDPVLLVLEDLQWADAESLALLAQVSALAGDRPLIVAGSYRDDEAPQLPSALPGMHRLRLERLDRPAIARLCESMLGHAGCDDRLVDLIARETEGNTYFIVEVMRALAEEAGGLAGVGRRGLPERILSGGVERMLDRRLARVPIEARGLLRLAAVAGRQLDLELLSRWEPRLGALVQACADAGVLGMREQRWRFDHDKLRERVLAEISPQELRALHVQVAEGLVAAYPGGRAAEVAHHFHEAGLLAEAAGFYAVAGEEALVRGAPGEAEVMLEQALALQGPVGAPDLWRVRLLRRLAHARFALGRLRGTDEALRQLCAQAGSPLPSSALGWCLATGRQAVEQAARSVGLARLLPARRRTGVVERALREEVLVGLAVQEVYLWLARPELSLLCTLWGLNLEEALSARRDTAFQASLAYLLSSTPLRRLGERYFELAVRSSPPGSRAEIDCLRGQSMIWLQRGRKAEGVRCAEQAVTLARASGDDVLLMHSIFQLQLAVAQLEDYPRVLDVCREMERLALRMQNPRYLVVALVGQGIVDLLSGDLPEAEAALDRALASVGDEVGPPLTAVALGLAAMCALEQGLVPLAEERGRAAMEAVRRSRWPMLELRYALFGVLNTALSIDPPERHAALTREALRWMHAVARQFPAAGPGAWMFEGRHRMRCGQPSGAASALRRSLRAAQREGVLADQAFAHHWLGRLARTPGGQRHVPEGAALHLEMAYTLFMRLGLVWEAERARAAF